MKEKDKAIRCLMDVVDLPPQNFIRPEDGRKANHLSRQRKALAVILAKRANPDGSQSYPSTFTMASALGLSRRSVFRLLDDLRALGFLRDGGLHPIHKTVIRSLDVRKMANVSPVTDSNSPVPDTRGTGDRLERSPVPDSFVTQPPLADRPSKPSSSTAPVSKLSGGGWEEEFFTSDHVYNRLDAMPKKVREYLMAESEKRGFPKVKCAVSLFLRESFDTAKAPWLLFLSKAESLFAKAEARAKQDPNDFRRRYVLTPEEVKRIDDAFIEQQMRENTARKTGSAENGVGWADFEELGLGEPTVEKTENPMLRFLKP